MAIATVTVGSSVGLHARPATLVAQEAGKYDEDITIRLADSDPEDAVDAGSSMMIMTLGAKAGDQVIVESEDDAAVAAVAALIEQNLDA